MDSEGRQDIRVGDLVSWEGGDAHEVVSADHAQGELPALIQIRCVRAATGMIGDEGFEDVPWAQVGDVNWLGSDEVDLLTRGAATG